MVKLIQRTTDDKYLQSLEGDIWVDNINDAFEMTNMEFQSTKQILLGTYAPGDLKEILNPLKYKQITKEEKKELRALLKN